MKEVEFRDRVPTHPGRVRLVPVSGNLYDMERADEPTETGTALNKVAFDSIIHSRLTGRYYKPTVSRVVYSAQSGVSASPIPTSGWVYDADNNNKATSGLYVVEASSNNGTAWVADGAFRSAGWQSSGGTESWLMIYHPQAIKLRTIRFRVEFQYPARFSALEIQGCNDGVNWNTVKVISYIEEDVTTSYSIDSPGEYYYYRLRFTNTESNRVTVSALSYALYDINTYSSAFTVSDGLPTSWTAEQRVMIATPASINSFAVVTNTLNGITVNTILQPNKRYELRYTGSAFAAKEV